MKLPDISLAVKSLITKIGGPLLAIDTATAIGSIALATSTKCYEQTLAAAARPSDTLACVINELFIKAGIGGCDLKGIIVGLGPGSFTGLRVALATVKGLAFSAETPVYGVSSLALLAAGYGVGLSAPILDARRGEVFCAVYEVKDDGVVALKVEDAVRTPLEFARLLTNSNSEYDLVKIIGDKSASSAEVANACGKTIFEIPAPRAAAGFLLAADRIYKQQKENILTLIPRYLRASAAEQSIQS